jgi:hypothetical protein
MLTILFLAWALARLALSERARFAGVAPPRNPLP